ncbi:uncharacterized protein LOC110034941 isoform X1 [Phalaenopsis equestris]|uniref:uncharacterized protein LOC110034941 isoform X1 n=1 Tax=Phalaenopsis equestris TaxID=78828 RepID=UPI0009E30813|nr:uncharacterized protein LOC110034941 isoform X1 [Phalaenopsis equestris]
MSAKNVATTRLQKPISDATIDPKVSSAGNKTSSVKAEIVIAKHVSSNRLGSQFISTSKDATLGDSNHPGVLDSAIMKTMEVNKSKTNSAKPSDAKSVRILEKRMECPLNVSSKTTNLASIEKKSSLSASLKRKIDEVS